MLLSLLLVLLDVVVGPEGEALEGLAVGQALDEEFLLVPRMRDGRICMMMMERIELRNANIMRYRTMSSRRRPEDGINK